MNFNLVETAAAFARAAHGAIDQRRKYTNEPYIKHPEAVAALVRTAAFYTDAMLAAAWLHDTVEDTKLDITDISAVFGHHVADLVHQLTDVSQPSDGNRAARKAIDRAHLATASRAAKTIKLADLIDNSRSIIDRDPEFARIYLAEKRLLLEVLTDGDPGLWKRAKEIVDHAT